MKPRRTVTSTKVFTLPGGNEDNDLWVTEYEDDRAGEIIGSTWVPTDAERTQIAAGANIELLIWGTGMPPVALRTSTYVLGKPPAPEGDPAP